MTTPRLAFVAAAAAAGAVLVPTVPVLALATTTDMIEPLARDAVEVLVIEQELVRLTDPRNTDISGPARFDAEQDLQMIDARGNEILVRLEQLDVDVSDAMRATLEVIPATEGRSPAQIALDIPADVVYEAAIADLNRIVEAPAATTVAENSPTAATTSLLVVAGLALVALAAAAVANQLGRRPEHELAAMAWSDALTGLANRRHLDHDVADPNGGTTAVIMVDVDHFKQVNDSFGHQRGDDVLREVGLMLERNVRIGDVVYRYGGEEFCVLLPDATVAEARRVAERIVEAAHTIELPDSAHLTVSVGVAGAHDGDVADAVVTADRALYDAKDQGRDRAVTAPDGRSLEPA